MKPQQRSAWEAHQLHCSGSVRVRCLPLLHTVFVHFQEYISFTPEQYLLGRNAKYKSVLLYALSTWCGVSFVFKTLWKFTLIALRVIKQLHRITVMLGIEGHSWIIPAFYLWCKASNFSGWLVWQYPCSLSLHWAVRVWCRNQLEESVGGQWRLTIPFRNITVTQRCACCWPLCWADIASRCFISLSIRNSGSDPRFCGRQHAVSCFLSVCLGTCTCQLLGLTKVAQHQECEPALLRAGRLSREEEV